MGGGAFWFWQRCQQCTDRGGNCGFGAAFERRQIADSARLSLETRVVRGLLELLPRSGIDAWSRHGQFDALASRMLSDIADLIRPDASPDAVLDRLESSLSRAKRDMQPSTAGSQLVPHQELQNQAREAPIASHELGTDVVHGPHKRRRRHRIVAGAAADR